MNPVRPSSQCVWAAQKLSRESEIFRLVEPKSVTLRTTEAIAKAHNEPYEKAIMAETHDTYPFDLEKDATM
jgi:hypothetical protein